MTRICCKCSYSLMHAWLNLRLTTYTKSQELRRTSKSATGVSYMFHKCEDSLSYVLHIAGKCANLPWLDHLGDKKGLYCRQIQSSECGKLLLESFGMTPKRALSSNQGKTNRSFGKSKIRRCSSCAVVMKAVSSFNGPQWFIRWIRPPRSQRANITLLALCT